MEKDKEIIKTIVDIVEKMKRKKPLVECLTNRVTINDCANMLLAMGASPIMAEIECEMDEIMQISDALVINLGLLDDEYLAAMRVAAKSAKKLNKPIIIDPVGAGASKLRDRVCQDMIESFSPDIIKGNLSEIKSLSGIKIASKGVDVSDEDAVNDENVLSCGNIVREYAKRIGAVVCATGEIDIISDGIKTVYVKNGSKMLSSVTGTGCMLSAMCGAMATAGSAFDASIAATLMLSISGELAEKYIMDTKQGIGTFKVKLFDYVYNLNEQDFINRSEVYYE